MSMMRSQPPAPLRTKHDAGSGTANSRKEGVFLALSTFSSTRLAVTFAGSRTINVRPIAVPLKINLSSARMANDRTWKDPPFSMNSDDEI